MQIGLVQAAKVGRVGRQPCRVLRLAVVAASTTAAVAALVLLTARHHGNCGVGALPCGALHSGGGISGLQLLLLLLRGVAPYVLLHRWRLRQLLLDGWQRPRLPRHRGECSGDSVPAAMTYGMA